MGHLTTSTNKEWGFANKTKLHDLKSKQPQISKMYFAIYPRYNFLIAIQFNNIEIRYDLKILDI